MSWPTDPPPVFFAPHLMEASLLVPNPNAGMFYNTAPRWYPTAPVTELFGTYTENFSIKTFPELVHFESAAPPMGQPITGVVQDIGGQPVARTVRAYDRATGALLSEATSDPVTGAYSLPVPAGIEVQRIALHDDGTGVVLNDLIDRVLSV